MDMLQKRFLFIVLSFCFFRTSHQTQFYTQLLKSQRNEDIYWPNCKYLVVCKRDTYESCKDWAHNIFEKKKKNICPIISIPKWCTKPIGSKYLIQKSIYILEMRVPIFIDWEENFAKANNINLYPTIILIKTENENTTELRRVFGEYSNSKLALF
tara:strand:- start:1602 stop:2066 length:465 start_codon:yes stop_codon:yes gene_type:complete